MNTKMLANALLDQILAERKLEDQREAENAPALTPEEVARERSFLKKWTRNGKKLINNAGGNFWMSGSNRNGCSIMKPALLLQLVNAGVLRQVGRSYEFISEQEAR